MTELQLVGVCHFLSVFCDEGDVCTIYEDGSILVGEDYYLIFGDSVLKALTHVNCFNDMTFNDYFSLLYEYVVD